MKLQYITFRKEYSAESIIDIERDVNDAIEDSNIPKDEHGFHKGTFKVTIEWSNE